MTCPRSQRGFMATCLGVSLGHRSLGGTSLWGLGDLVGQIGLARGVWAGGLPPRLTLPPRAGWGTLWGERVRLLITTLIRERKQSWQGLGIF